MSEAAHPDLTGERGSGTLPCKRCGAPTPNLGQVCAACLMERHLGEELEYLRVTLKEQPRRAIVLARDVGAVQHLVLFRLPSVAWCGQRVTEKLSRRRHVAPGKFPPGVCARCLERYAELR